jgi:hypothetical protein
LNIATGGLIVSTCQNKFLQNFTAPPDPKIGAESLEKGGTWLRLIQQVLIFLIVLIIPLLLDFLDLLNYLCIFYLGDFVSQANIF